MPLPLIELKAVTKSFKLESGRELLAIENISLALRSGDLLALLGPSGSGKSTCLRLMCGLHTPTQGSVLVNSEPLVGVSDEVSVVFQSFALLPWETVYRNISIALHPAELSSEERDARVKEAITIVGLEGFEEAYPRELSGGMKQRVGMARALAMHRPILFLDEPFSALDVLTSETLRQEILRIYLSKQTALRAMMIVTHNIQEAVLMASRIVVLGSNPGHVRHEFSNTLPYPRNEESAEFKDLVTRIHHLIAETYMPDLPEERPLVTTAPARPHPEILPPVPMLEMIGLIEAIHSEGNSVDLFQVADELGYDFGHTLYLVKAVELLDLAETPKQRVNLTPRGIEFADSDTKTRKRMIRQSLEKLTIVQVATELLRSSGIARLPLQDFTAHIQVLIPRSHAEPVVEALIGWGRFAEYFGYNDDTKTIYLDVGQDVGR